MCLRLWQGFKLGRLLQRPTGIGKQDKSFPAEIALAPLIGTLGIAVTNLETGRHATQLMKVKKLWVRVRTSKVPESPPNSSVDSN